MMCFYFISCSLDKVITLFQFNPITYLQNDQCSYFKPWLLSALIRLIWLLPFDSVLTSSACNLTFCSFSPPSHLPHSLSPLSFIFPYILTQQDFCSNLNFPASQSFTAKRLLLILFLFLFLYSVFYSSTFISRNTLYT